MCAKEGEGVLETTKDKWLYYVKHIMQHSGVCNCGAGISIKSLAKVLYKEIEEHEGLE